MIIINKTKFNQILIIDLIYRVYRYNNLKLRPEDEL